MAVVIVQSRATAHVYRVFGALMGLLLLMAVAVGLVRARTERGPASPYGALGAVVPTSASTAVTAPSTNEAVAPVGTAVAMASPGLAAAPAPVAEASRTAPREIAIDKAAAGSIVPQPAPPAVVQAAARAAAAAPAPSPNAVEPADPAPGPAAAPDKSGQAGLVNINTASVDQLNNIPGGGHIGRSIAKHRPYRSVSDLVDHRVLKARDFAHIKSAITVE